jgi:hypothetical protein
MKTIFHKSLTQEIWNSKPFRYQILTMGAEFGRAKSMVLKNNIPEVKNSLERVMELLDLTKSDPKWYYKLKELTRFREWTGEFYINQPDNLQICLDLYKFLLQWHPSTDGVPI